MKRRTFFASIAALAVAVPIARLAQPAEPIPKIGTISIAVDIRNETDAAVRELLFNLGKVERRIHRINEMSK